jgi:hypothetical protein
MVAVCNKVFRGNQPCQYEIVSHILDTIFELAGVTLVASNLNDS